MRGNYPRILLIVQLPHHADLMVALGGCFPFHFFYCGNLCFTCLNWGFKNGQATFSLQGGVVSDPFKRKRAISLVLALEYQAVELIFLFAQR